MTLRRSEEFDEFTRAQEILKNGFSKGVLNRKDLLTLAKHYFSIGIVGNKLRQKLIEFCKQYSFGFNEIIHRNTILEAIKNAEKYTMRLNNSVCITTTEINIIKELPEKYAKVLFVMLAHAKYNKNNNTLRDQEKIRLSEKYYFKKTLRDALGMAKTYMQENEIKIMKHFLDAESGYISATEVGKQTWEVCIIDNDSDIEIIINDMNKVIDFFPSFCVKYKKIMDVEEKSKMHKLCKECYKEKRKADIKYNVNKIRQKQSM